MFYCSKNDDKRNQYSNFDLILDAQEKLEKLQHSFLSVNPNNFDQTPKNNNKMIKTAISTNIIENNLQYPYIIESKTKYSNPYSNNSNEEGVGFNILKHYISHSIDKGNNSKFQNSYHSKFVEENLRNSPPQAMTNNENYLDNMKLNEYISSSSRSENARTKSFSTHCEILKPFIASACENYIKSNETNIKQTDSNTKSSKNMNSLIEDVILTPEKESIKRGKNGNNPNLDKIPNSKFDKTISHYSDSKAMYKSNITNLMQKTIETEKFFKSFPVEFIEKDKKGNSFKSSNKKRIFDLKVPASIVSSTPNRGNANSEFLNSKLENFFQI